MSEDEAEKFEITEEDLQNEFNINRPRGKFSKHQQIYGIWADEGSSEDEGTSKRPSFKKERKPKNYTAPIGFVAGGTQQAGKKQKEEKKESDDDDNDAIGHRRMGRRRQSSSDESEDERPASFKQNVQYETSGDIAGLRKHRTPTDTSLMKKGVGGWEKHTKGIGAKLLLQMGYEPGKGLGKALQGINAPIVAKLRKGRGAIGAYGPEEAARIAELKTDKPEKVVEKLSRWRKDDETLNKKVRYVYKTIDEVIQQGEGQPGSTVPVDSALSKVKVIDMTGPEQRILSGYHAISRQQRPTSEWEARKDLKTSNFSMPELQHNLNLLVDLCEQDIVSNNRKYKYASDKIVCLNNEKLNLERASKTEELEISRLEELLIAVEDLTAADKSKRMDLNMAAITFKKIMDSHPIEYRNYDLPELAASLVTPLVRSSLSSWDPLQWPEQPMGTLLNWRPLVENQVTVLTSTVANPEPWGKLLWHAWIPTIRCAVGAWNSRQPDQMLRLVESWKAVVPPWIIQYIVESLVLPRMTLHVSEWDPMTDTVPIHYWIHPWLPYLSVQLSTVVFPMIRQKLGQALTAWSPSDRSARLMLLPWNGVFTKGEMNAFLIRNILPKLQETMDEFLISPQHQVLDKHWAWVMDWIDLMPIPSMVSLMEKHFFPKWFQVLAMWLNHNPNYEQIGTWYVGWKAQFPEILLKQTVIKDEFREALDMMNRSASATPGAKESISYLRNLDREASTSTTSQTASAKLQSITEAVLMGAEMSVTGLRGVIAKKCEEKDIVFIPIPNKTHEGKQVYRCGNVQLYIDRNVAFVSSNGGITWQPLSVNTLLTMAEK